METELSNLHETMLTVHSLLDEQKEKLEIIEKKTVIIPSKLDEYSKKKIITEYTNTKTIICTTCGVLIGALGFTLNPIIGIGTIIVGGWTGLTISKIKM